jgi:hypothetical protein
MDNKIGLIVFKDDVLIGIFDNEKSLTLFLDGGIQNNFFTKESMRVEAYAMNSCYKYNDQTSIYNINNVNIVNSVNSVKTTINKLENEDNVRNKMIEKLEANKIKKILEKKKEDLKNSEDFIKIQQDKIDLKHDINELKIKQKKLKEEEISFKNDVEVYKQLTKELDKNPEFVIPELFKDKFNLIIKLERANNLTFIDFKKEWDIIKPKNNYNLFTTTTYEDSFKEKKQVQFKEVELEI